MGLQLELSNSRRELPGTDANIWLLLLLPQFTQEQAVIHWMSSIWSRIPFISPFCYSWGITTTSWITCGGGYVIDKIHFRISVALTKTLVPSRIWEVWETVHSHRVAGKINEVTENRTGLRAQRVATAEEMLVTISSIDSTSNPPFPPSHCLSNC